MNVFAWIIVIVVILAGAASLVVVGIRTASRAEERDPLMERLAEFTERGDVVSLEE